MHRRFTILPSENRLYAKQGFLVKPRFISSLTIQKTLRCCDRLIRQASGQKTTSSYVHDQPGKSLIIGDLPFHQPEFISPLASLDIWKAASWLLGTSNLVYHYSQLIIKKPYSESEIRWHRDFNNRYLSPIHSDFLRVFIPLSNLTLENGAPLLIPGSNNICDRAVKLAKQKHIKQFPAKSPLISQPGDIIFLHPKILHTSQANHSATTRMILVMQIAKAGVPLNVSRIPEKLGGLSRLQLVHYKKRRHHETI